MKRRVVQMRDGRFLVEYLPEEMAVLVSEEAQQAGIAVIFPPDWTHPIRQPQEYTSPVFTIEWNTTEGITTLSQRIREALPQSQ